MIVSGGFFIFNWKTDRGQRQIAVDDGPCSSPSVVATMRQTGADMQSRYKETSLGGLAVNFIEC
jgi:L-serine deaminase